MIENVWACSSLETVGGRYRIENANSDDSLHVLDVWEQHQHLRHLPYYPNSHERDRRTLKVQQR